MLTIRNAQFRTLSLDARRRFEQRVARHLAKFFPDRTAAMDSGELVALIRHGCDRATAHGFKSARDVCKYIDLMVVFGPDFDVDPRHAWAREILDRPAEDRSAKMRELVSAGVECVLRFEVRR